MGANESLEEIVAMENYQWYAKFMKECPSGQLTMFECKRILGLENTTTQANNYVEKVFNIFDTNKDGFIDYLELLAAINLVIRGKIDQKLKWYFKLYDIDGNGTIDKKEVISMLMAIQTVSSNQEMTPEELTNLIFQKIDVNNDDFHEYRYASLGVFGSFPVSRSRYSQSYMGKDLITPGLAESCHENQRELTLEELMNGVEKDEHFCEIISKSFELSNVLKILQSGRRHSV